ncbi:hypothetical protein FRC12_005522 [Ceratobasidium sp. 428]|nr:hypothetical protein FRC12_005522 [Ceratobasidium sp. 428]
MCHVGTNIFEELQRANYGLVRLDHPNIARVSLSRADLTFYQDFCEQGDLRSYLKQDTLIRPVCCSIIEGILRGLTYLHNHDPIVVHGSLNPGKVFITSNGNVKIGEFGLAESMAKISHLLPTVSFNGLVRWTSPERLKLEAGGYEESSLAQFDIWSLGCTLLEVLTGCLPYSKYKYDPKVVRGIVNKEPPGHVDQVTLSFDKLSSSGAESNLTCKIFLQELIRSCWNDVHERPLSKDLLEKPLAELVGHLTQHGCRDLTSDLDSSSFSAQPVAYGGLGTVYCEKLRDGRRVAIKALRVPLNDDEKANELPMPGSCMFGRDASIPTFFHFLDWCYFKVRFEWYHRGSRMGVYPPISINTPMPIVVICEQSTQICDGVAYLHRTGIVHGNLKGRKVLVSEQNVLKITGFGNAILEQDTIQFIETAEQDGFTLRWTAPEILDGTTSQSRESDVYALGMVGRTSLSSHYCLTPKYSDNTGISTPPCTLVQTSQTTAQEVITGKLPYYYIQNSEIRFLFYTYGSLSMYFVSKDHVVMAAVVLKNETPKRPEECIPSSSQQGDTLWSLLMSCWERESEKRPKTDKVVELMKAVTRDGLMPLKGVPGEQVEPEPKH